MVAIVAISIAEAHPCQILRQDFVTHEIHAVECGQDLESYLDVHQPVRYVEQLHGNPPGTVEPFEHQESDKQDYHGCKKD